jgi:hypothetical protein
MGFDIYGLAPKLKSKQPTIDWENATKEDQDNYFQKRQKWEDENPGSYFRNNVWWWRPLANIILDKCSDLITHEQAHDIHNNSGRRFSKGTSIAIANRLQSLIDNGFIDRHEKEIDARVKKAKEHNKKVEAKLKALKEKVEELRPNQNLAPKDYPSPYDKHWTEINNERDWGSSYPFSKENVIEFIKFSRASGGFEIC